MTADPRGNPDTVERLTAIADDECVYDTDDVDTIRWAVRRIEELEASQEFWATSWSDEHTANVLANKRIEELEAAIDSFLDTEIELWCCLECLNASGPLNDLRRALREDDR